MMRQALSWDLARRKSLGQRATEALEADPRVERLELYGSLSKGTEDIFSDLDFIAHLKPGVGDRKFFFSLPTVMDVVGPRIIDGWGFSALPHHYVGTFYFVDLPLFWHVDVTCRPAAPEWHVDGSDLVSVPRWEQRFKIWTEVALRLARLESHQLTLATSWTSMRTSLA